MISVSDRVVLGEAPHNKPVVEILGPWLKNNGDYLNLWSIVNWLSPMVDIAVSSTLGLDQLPLKPTLRQVHWRIDRAAAGRALRSHSIRDIFRFFYKTVMVTLPGGHARAISRGIVPGNNLSALVDCSGYAYGDPWGIQRVLKRTAYFRRLKRYRIPVFMLPQAFGPFDDKNKRNACIRLFNLCDIIYARDRTSLGHLQNLNLDTNVTGPMPDVTHLLRGSALNVASEWGRRVSIVPNARMLDRTDSQVRKGYIGMIRLSIESVRNHDLEPVLLLHEANDRSLAEEIAAAMPIPIPIIDDDALMANAFIASSYAVIGSRYHALVSALSNAVPALATSWSHKYEALFHDYGCVENVLSVKEDPNLWQGRIDQFLKPEIRDAQHRLLTEKAKNQLSKLKTMQKQLEPALIGSAGRA